MRGTKTILPIAIAVLLAACGGNKGEKKPTFNAAAELGKVKAARSALMTARGTLDKVRAELAPLKDGEKLSAAEETQKGQLEIQLKQAQDAFDSAYSADQQALTDFLNVALNDMPNAPETREGLTLYAQEAIRNANDFINNNGDYAKAIDLLQTAEGYFEAVSAQIPADLKQEIDKAKSLRFLSKDRFDQVRNGMTQADARLVTGTPFYANVREHEVKGKKIVTWLFTREDGGVAAVYFQGGKVYAKAWDVKEQK